MSLLEDNLEQLHEQINDIQESLAKFSYPETKDSSTQTDDDVSVKIVVEILSFIMTIVAAFMIRLFIS